MIFISLGRLKKKPTKETSAGVTKMLDDMKKKGTLLDFGFFLDGTSGYAMGEGTGETAFRGVSMFLPFMKCEVYEIVSYKRGKELVREVHKALSEAARQ